MAKPKNTDDLMFDTSDEFFPLDNSSTKGDKTKAPKGVKSYLKNVAKSVKNLSVSVAKTMYPEADKLVKAVKGDQDEGKAIDIKATINKYKGYVTSAKAEVDEIARDIGKSAKEAVKSGYFVKTEEEANDMSAAFGDMFGDDFDFGDDFGDFGGDDDFGSDFDDDDYDSGSSKKGRINTGDAVIRSSAASTKTLLHASNKQSSIIIGATQSQIKHETRLFAQQIMIEQEHHKEKMRVLKNIASNIGKTVNQNNISIKAQMEYSLKSLAFTQDINAMLKEIRDAQWALTKPEEDETPNERETMRKKVFGSFGDELNLSHWMKHLKGNFGGGNIGMLGMALDGYKMMTDMGMGKGQVVMNMAGPMILESIINGMTSSSAMESRTLLNKSIAGLPRQLNQMLGNIASGDNGAINKLETALNKTKFGSKVVNTSIFGNTLGGWLQTLAGKAYIDDDTVYSTNRYTMGDPNTVHPFDNKAHKALTEVIPGFLSKISAGVNHTEEQVFDYDSNRFIKKSYFKELAEEMHNNTVQYTENFHVSQERFLNASSKHDYSKVLKNVDKTSETFKQSKYVDENGDPKLENLEQIYPKMLENWMSTGRSISDSTIISKMRGDIDKNGKFVPGRYSDVILRNIPASDYEKYVLTASFADFLLEWAKDADKGGEASRTWREFQLSCQNYRERLSTTNMEFEDIANMTSSSGLAQEININKQYETTLNNLRSKLKNLEAQRDSPMIKGKARINLQNNINDIKTQINDINKDRGKLSDEGINAGMSAVYKSFASSESKDEFDKYRISSLEDSSTHGLVQNIYNLLLSGIDVYAHDPNERKESDSNFISSAKQYLPSKISTAKEADDISKERLQYQEMYFPNGTPTDSEGIKDVLYNNSITDDKGKIIYNGKIYRKKDGKMEGVSPSSITFEDGVQYFLKNSEKAANDQEQNRRYEIERRKEEEEKRRQKANGEDVDDRDWSLPFQDVPVIGRFVKMFNDIDKGFSGTMNKILGRKFYGEVGEGKIKDTVTKSAEDIKNSTIKSAKGAVEDITGGKIKSYVADKLLSIKVGDDTLATTIAKINDPVLMEKLKAEKNPIKQGKILIEYGKNNVDIQKYTIPIRSFIEKNESLMKASSSIKGLTSWVKDKVTSKISAGANKVFAKIMQGKLGKDIYNITIDGKTFQTALSEYYEANPAIKEANIAKGNAFEQTPGAKDIKEVAKFLKETFTSIDDPSIEPYKSQIVTICDEYASGDKSTISGAATSAVTKGINKVINFFKNKAKGLLEKANKGKDLIPDDMAKLQSVDGRTLGDVIEKVASDEGFKDILRNIPGGAAKAEFIIHQKSPELAGFTAALREYQKGNIKDGFKSAGKGIKTTLVGAAAFASGAWNGSNLAHKDDESDEANEDGTDNKTKKERLRDRIKNRFKRKGNSDSVEGNSADEQTSLKLAKQESKDKEETKSLFKRMAETLESFKKEGIPLDKETKKTIEDANEKGAFESEAKNGEGVLSTIRGFLDKTGLGNTKMGRALGKATDAVGGLLDKAGDMADLVGGKGGKGKLISGLANTLSKIPGVGGALSGVVGAVAGGGGLVSTAASVVSGVGGVLKGALGVLKTVLDKFFNLGPIKKWFKGGAVNAIKNGIAKGVTKFAPKLGAKIAAMSAASATLIVAVATAAAGFAKGMLKAKDYFKVGKGMRITVGMKLASGLANAFDMLLMGIPSLICGWLGKANVATWLYEFFGGEAEKMALERYQEYNAKRAVVFGISDPNALVAYENRSVADGIGEGLKQGFFKFLRGTASVLTLGLVDGNDEKDAKMLGFKYKKIFKYWKEKKFKPLNELREKVANEMGVKLKDMEDITAVDPTEVDEDDDGNVDNTEKAQEEMQKLELQTKYRVTYLEACRKYVLSNKIAWLTSRCTPEEFEKYTGGKDAGKEMKSTGEKFVSRLMAPVNMVKAAGAGVKKVGGAIADGVKATGEAISNAGKRVTDWLKRIYKKYNMDDKTQKLMDSAGDDIASVHLGVDKNYYGETPAGDVSVGTAGTSEGLVHAEASGSPEPVGKEGYYVRVKTDRATLKSVPNKEDLDRDSTTSRSSGGTSRTSPQDTTYDLSGKTPKGIVMNSIAQEFAKNFGAELNKKLDILAEMHRENLRHHDVTEKFFTAALQMLGTIAANSGNRAMATKFSDMVNQVAKF